MRLLLDQGNSRLKWLLVAESGEFLARGVCVAGSQLDEELSRVVAFAGQRRITSVALSAVASIEQVQGLSSAVISIVGVVPRIMVSASECAGLHSGYIEPYRLGVDRWMAMLGARSLGGGAWLVVDAGTAMTVDAVSASGSHLGGYIVPGYRMQLSMLATQTAGIGSVTSAGGTGWGRDTVSAVANGVTLAMASLVDRSLVELTKCGDDTCRLVITGGDADLLAPYLKGVSILDPDLLFRGMLVAMSETDRTRN